MPLVSVGDNVDKAIDKVLNFSKNSFSIFKSSQIEEKYFKISFCELFMDENPEISMRNQAPIKIGACKIEFEEDL